MPNLGIIMPIMGINGKRPRRNLQLPKGEGLADALFSRTQQRVLGLLFGQPERSFYATEIIGLTGGGSGAVQRELARLARSGLITVRALGNQKHYQANQHSPLFVELCGIVLKTVSLVEPLREALQSQAGKIEAAFVFGSVAKRQDSAASDIDLMVISDTLGYADVFVALEDVSVRLGRPVNPTIMSRADLDERLRDHNAFVTRVMSLPRIWVLGAEDVLSAH